ncbi:MAG: hypothetical protein MK279_06735 [Gemmatimonadetes bacterium]|jgi:hypothetical protein|nr:hypothetical protein [Gemmatimonadota bacterium]GIS80161.1 MAG: hypothetical protein CM1200mP14_17270 [Gammaproteobacteria bacterium]MEC7386078.1 hypothetical protein [Gemmatimonadota bacterium]MEC9355977.1 hypothetical protein [Gemmatimonadota bacterium]GIT50537.1 MAG: hypothetical protein Ct9H300mP15_07500 [Gemmatimonadota bacterium]|tara:strand:+ start:5736 stop:6047 length:312 start_codon:yes stop_codon:yes gene_type:complete
MSNPAGNGEGLEQAAFIELERIVDAALRHLGEVTRRAEMAEDRNAEFEALIKRFAGDEGDAGQVLHRLAELEEDNENMRSRLEAGQVSVDKLIAKIRFMEEQK